LSKIAENCDHNIDPRVEVRPWDEVVYYYLGSSIFSKAARASVARLWLLGKLCSQVWKDYLDQLEILGRMHANKEKNGAPEYKIF
jgi:hypothetical protein